MQRRPSASFILTGALSECHCPPHTHFWIRRSFGASFISASIIGETMNTKSLLASQASCSSLGMFGEAQRKTLRRDVADDVLRSGLRKPSPGR